MFPIRSTTRYLLNIRSILIRGNTNLSHISHSSAEEDESSAHVKTLTKSQHKVPPEPQLQDSTDPVFYREIDMTDQANP